jgi:hypothetical protein
MYNRLEIERAVKAKGYAWFTGLDFDVNIVGIRNSETYDNITNKFDDIITVSYRLLDGEWEYFEFACTTDPGKYWAENLMNESGVAILKEGQYRGSHKIRKHRGQYDALCQKAPLQVYRDKNLDECFDLIEENIKEGIYGINIHKAGRDSKRVDKWSAGCQVIANESDWNVFMAIMYEARNIWGNSFTYTLINSNDITKIN